MNETVYHLNQFNIARIRAPLDHPDMAGFVAALKPINALADGSPGFVWRLQTEDGDSTAIRPYADARILVTLSVWESIEALYRFSYTTGHAGIMARRREWFEELEPPYLVLWWAPAGRLPTVEEGKGRLELLRRGPTREAFTFRHHFPAPGNLSQPAADRADLR